MALIYIWGDESSQNNHNYMVLGTIWQNPICAVELERDIQNLRNSTSFHKEFHWNEIKGHHINAYKGLVEIFYEYMKQGLIKFRALVVDQTDRNHRQYSDHDELHFYKMFYWLIYKRLLPVNEYDLYLDRKSNSVSGRLTDLKGALNNKMKSDYLQKHHSILHKDVVRLVEPRDGNEVELQLADVFAGAIAYVRNGFFDRSVTPSRNNAKIQLVLHIESQFNLSLESLCHQPDESPGFNIWCFRR